MAATIMDGKALAAKWKENIKTQVAALSQRPGLAVILVGNDPASRVYVTNKEKDCAQCGIYSEEFALPAEIGQKALLELIDELNRRPQIDGILCQLPLPRGYDYDEEQVLQAIDPRKDVDAFHPYNVGRIMIGDYTFLPCTPAGVMALLDEYGIDPAGKRCVVVGRSN
ncbi:MAG: bifunctional 5,10-methylene-tetrahydrofolate dehydrogenase/5,10-methylene-tetrahydrofolate cyclohydrolase, partial [Clostridiales bacterium]|nr:bifunctional 5,10-methylene-tetrahydrofolate dehydrogenase/5,10-methylene-tetrahydrofolate cyclohydrolase [Clostridiales bacterium]